MSRLENVEPAPGKHGRKGFGNGDDLDEGPVEIAATAVHRVAVSLEKSRKRLAELSITDFDLRRG